MSTFRLNSEAGLSMASQLGNSGEAKTLCAHFLPSARPELFTQVGGIHLAPPFYCGQGVLSL